MTPPKPETTLIHLSLIDSTNNYAMQLLDAEAAGAGTIIVADEQSAGKGQRGRTWLDVPGQSLLMSTILAPEVSLEYQFSLSAAIAVTVAEFLMEIHEHWDIRIKWPNDILINDRKAGGILIENVLRGSRWSWCVVGLGLNVRQPAFPESLPFATSLRKESGKDFEVMTLAGEIGNRFLSLNAAAITDGTYLARYNQYLYRKDALQRFTDDGREWTATVLNVTPDGQLQVLTEDGIQKQYRHGEVVWKWE